MTPSTFRRGSVLALSLFAPLPLIAQAPHPAESGSPPVARQPFMTCCANSRCRGCGGAKLKVA